MSLNIFDHPTVQRLVGGEPVPIQELRQAIVDFWKENGVSEICGSCRRWERFSNIGPAVGCCGQCRYLDFDRGCTKRNLMCQAYTCPELVGLLRKARLLGSWLQFKEMLRPLEEDWDQRLPDGALVFLSDWCSYHPSYFERRPAFLSPESARLSGNHCCSSDAWERRIRKWKEKRQQRST